jgi:hypothetical protein
MKLQVLFTFIGFTIADTLTVNFWETLSNCLAEQPPDQSFRIGNLNECHNLGAPMAAVNTQDVAQSFFGRHIHVLAYDGTDCTGGVVGLAYLTNNPDCDDGPYFFESFQIAES